MSARHFFSRLISLSQLKPKVYRKHPCSKLKERNVNIDIKRFCIEEWRPRSRNNYFHDFPKTKAVVWNWGGGCQTKCERCKNWQRPTSSIPIPGLPSVQRCLQTKTERGKKITNVRGKQMTLLTTLQTWSAGWQICFAEKSVSEHQREHLANELETWNKQLSGLFPGQGRKEINTGFGIVSSLTRIYIF